MKKLIKAASILAAIAMLGAAFVSCSSDDDSADETPATKPAGGDTPAPTPAGPVTPTSCSIDFTSDEVFASITALGFTTADASKGDSITACACTINKDETLSFADGVTMLLSKEGTGGLTCSNSKDATFKYNTKADCGFVVKLDALKFSGIKGKCKVTVKWAINGKKAANDRTIYVKAGTADEIAVGNLDTTAASSNITAFDDIVTTYDFGNGGELLIGTSNELGIKGLVIEAAE